MIKVAIVDDEIYAIRHMEKMLSKVHTGKLLTYTSPQRALQELPAQNPQILFVDIMMPVMTGLEFAEQYLKQCPFAVLVILTSYRDFDFAKKSVELGVYDYWLKNELRLGSFQEKWDSLLSAASQKEEHRATGQRELVARIFAGRAGVEEAFSQKACSRYFVLGLERGDTKPESELADFVEVTESTAFVQGIGLNSGFSFCLCRYTEEEESLWPEMLKLAEKSVKHTSCILSLPFAVENSRERIGNFFSIIHNFHLPHGSLGVPLEDISLYREDTAFLEELGSRYFGALPRLIQAHNKEGIYSALRQLWSSEVLRSGNRAAFSYCVSRLRQIGHSLFEGGKWNKMLERLSEEFEQMGLWQMQKTAGLAFEGLLSAWNNGLRYNSPFVNLAVKYIEDNYAEDLHLALIAEKLSLSPDYLRKLFKGETGVGIGDYITATRMAVAKELLKSGAYKVYEVADMVGYNSAAYFSQAYVKHYGVSPKEGQREKTV